MPNDISIFSPDDKSEKFIISNGSLRLTKLKLKSPINPSGLVTSYGKLEVLSKSFITSQGAFPNSVSIWSIVLLLSRNSALLRW